MLVNPIAFDDVPADDIKTMQRNTARFALRISRGVLGAAPLMRELLEQSVADPANMPDALVARYLAPYVGQEGLNHLLALARAVDDEDMAEVELGQIDRPTLDRLGRPGSVRRSQSSGSSSPTRFRGAGWCVCPGTGRLVPEEAPETLAK